MKASTVVTGGGGDRGDLTAGGGDRGDLTGGGGVVGRRRRTTATAGAIAGLAALVLGGCGTGTPLGAGDGAQTSGGIERAQGGEGAEGAEGGEAPPTSAPGSTSAMDCIAEDIEPGPPLEGWSEEVQDVVLPWATRIDTVLLNHPDYRDIGVLYEPPGVQIWFAGPLPADLDPVIAEVEAAGIRVVHPETRYSGHEMGNAVAALADALDEAGIEVSSFGTWLEPDELHVSGPVLSTDCATQAEVLTIARFVIGDMPLRIVPDEGGGELVGGELAEHAEALSSVQDQDQKQDQDRGPLVEYED